MVVSNPSVLGLLFPTEEGDWHWESEEKVQMPMIQLMGVSRRQHRLSLFTGLLPVCCSLESSDYTRKDEKLQQEEATYYTV